MAQTPFRLRVPLRGRDVDTLGHLNHSIYHVLLEEGRTGLIATALDAPAEDVAALPFVLVHVSMDYHREVRLTEGAVDVVVWVMEMGTSSFRLGYELRRMDEVVAASGQAVMVAWDSDARSKRTLTETERTALSAQLVL
jgi:acyl-CoA thioester hydrolase